MARCGARYRRSVRTHAVRLLAFENGCRWGFLPAKTCRGCSRRRWRRSLLQEAPERRVGDGQPGRERRRRRAVAGGWRARRREAGGYGRAERGGIKGGLDRLVHLYGATGAWATRRVAMRRAALPRIAAKRGNGLALHVCSAPKNHRPGVSRQPRCAHEGRCYGQRLAWTLVARWRGAGICGSGAAVDGRSAAGGADGLSVLSREKSRTRSA